jgi:hypothetical protein
VWHLACQNQLLLRCRSSGAGARGSWVYLLLSNLDGRCHIDNNAYYHRRCPGRPHNYWTSRPTSPRCPDRSSTPGCSIYAETDALLLGRAYSCFHNRVACDGSQRRATLATGQTASASHFYAFRYAPCQTMPATPEYPSSCCGSRVGVLSYIAFNAAANSPMSKILEYYAIRWLLGLLWIVALFETIAWTIRVITGMFGAEIPLLHDAPYKARTLREFWSVRWNKLVGRWLREHCYTPLTHRGYGRLALTASFAGSAAIHLYITSVMLDLRWGLIMASLFLLQVPLLWAEDALNIRHRSAVVGHIWTLGILILCLRSLRNRLCKCLVFLECSIAWTN